MITLEQAKNLKYGEHIHHVRYKNADGTPQRFKINGKPKTWKTRPDEVEIPLKRGMRETYHIDESDLKDYNLGMGY